MRKEIRLTILAGIFVAALPAHMCGMQSHRSLFGRALFGAGHLVKKAVTPRVSVTGVALIGACVACVVLWDRTAQLRAQAWKKMVDAGKFLYTHRPVTAGHLESSLKIDGDATRAAIAAQSGAMQANVNAHTDATLAPLQERILRLEAVLAEERAAAAQRQEDLARAVRTIHDMTLAGFRRVLGMQQEAASRGVLETFFGSPSPSPSPTQLGAMSSASSSATPRR